MTYKEGIVKAITELKDRNGSSSIAIKKHMQDNLPKDKKWQNATFLASLKSCVASGELIQNKNSYKLSSDYKKKLTKKDAGAGGKESKPKKKAAAKPKSATAKKTATKKKSTGAKKTATAKAVSII